MSLRSLPTNLAKNKKGRMLKVHKNGLVPFLPKRLSEEEKRELVLKVANFSLSQTEAVNYVREHFGMKIGQPGVSRMLHSKKWLRFFEFERRTYLEGVNQVAGFHKRVRLERQEEIYKECRKARNYKLALQATRDQLEEVTPKYQGTSFGDTYNFNTQNNQFNAMSDEEFKVRKMEIAKRIKELEQKGETNGSSRPAEENTK